MQRTITTQQAALKTATIAVKVLTVDNRKLTLSVFRQIPEDQLLDDETLEVRGIPWGLVNYFWDDAKGWSGLHVLWQRGDELRRALVPHPSWFNGRVGAGSEFAAFNNLIMAVKREEALLEELVTKSSATERVFGGDVFQWGTLALPYVYADPTAQPPARPAHWKDEEYAGVVERHEKNLQRIRDARSKDLDTLHAAKQRTLQADAALDAYRTTYRQRYAELAAMEQLFIAV